MTEYSKVGLRKSFDSIAEVLVKMIKQDGWTDKTLKNFYKIKKLLVEIDELLDGRL